MTLLRPLLAALLLLPATLHADATRGDWMGGYAMDHDGHQGTLTIASSPRHCIVAGCIDLIARYVDQRGDSFPVAVTAFDENGQHLGLTIDFPGSPQPFDLYIFSFEKTRLAGTTVWQGRTFGVTATRTGSAATVNPAPATTSAASRQTVSADGKITKRLPDGTVKTKALNGCGWDVTTPTGRVIRAQCTFALVIPIIPPDPPSGSPQDRWLHGQDENLLSILQALLDPVSYQNYLNNYESTPGTAIYKQVYYRTKAIVDFTSPQ